MNYLHSSFHAVGRPSLVGRLERSDKILCDVDGCLISGDRVLPGAEEFVQRFSKRLVLVSNNSTDTAQSLSQRLARIGLEIAPQRIFLAGEMAVRFIREKFGNARVFVLANRRIRGLISECGLRMVDDQPDVLLLCRDTDLTLSRAEMALRFMSKRVPMVVSNLDLIHPGTLGPALETGALFAMLSACVEPERVYRLGKPQPELFQMALGATPPDRAVMIGDNPQTDGAGAQAIGLSSIIFGFGQFHQVRNFRDLLQP